MPRGNRIVPPGGVLHIVNRGNDKKVIFPEPVDYAAFSSCFAKRVNVWRRALRVLSDAQPLPSRRQDGWTRRNFCWYMHFVQREHACDLRRCWRSRGHGHVFQRRYWSKVVEGDGYLMTVMRYVEANPFRAALVEASQSWEWSSLWDRETGERDLLHPSPIWLPDAWRTIVTVPLQSIDLERIRRPEKIGRPRARDLRAA